MLSASVPLCKGNLNETADINCEISNKSEFNVYAKGKLSLTSTFCCEIQTPGGWKKNMNGCLSTKSTVTARVNVKVIVNVNNIKLSGVSLKYVSNYNSQKVEIFYLFSQLWLAPTEIERREWTASEKSAWLFSFSIVWKAPLSKLGYMQNSWENIIGGCENNFFMIFSETCWMILWDSRLQKIKPDNVGLNNLKYFGCQVGKPQIF